MILWNLHDFCSHYFKVLALISNYSMQGYNQLPTQFVIP